MVVTSWRETVKQAETLEDLKQRLEEESGDVFPDSLQLAYDKLLFMVKEARERRVVVVSDREGTDQFEGEVSNVGVFMVKQVALNGKNAKVLRSLLTWTAPQALGTSGISMGLGDRLGLASPGHLKAIRDTPVRPVLAQQSMRELELTNRTYVDVLDAATWAVFQEGYQGGYGADGDHLKKIEDILMALELGFSMITLDCSEHINDEILDLTEAEVLSQYNQLPKAKRKEFEELYCDQRYELQNGATIYMDPEHYQRMALTYHQALDFMEKVYEQVITKLDRPIDFEISIDEVATPTTPQDHFFVANELKKRGIKVCSVAPRFYGHFEKGIDYMGDLEQFEQEFAVHADISSHFGYKLSIHSGSDKFSVFPIIGKYARATGYHVKTAGTNWLEAVRVIAHVDPCLYRALHQKALDSLKAARKYYHVSMDLAKVPEIDTLEDQELPGLLDQDDARQLLHITYGFMLQDPKLKEGIYEVLKKHEGRYEQFLVCHMNRHLKALGIKQ
jgi:hypothetical protein